MQSKNYKSVEYPWQRLRSLTSTFLGFGNSKYRPFRLSNRPGGVGHGPKGIMGKKSKTVHLHLTLASHAGLFRGARISSLPSPLWGGKKYELP